MKSAISAPSLLACQEMYHSTVRLAKSAISAPTFLLGHQMYHSTVRLWKSAISAPNLLVGQQMYHSTIRLAKSLPPSTDCPMTVYCGVMTSLSLTTTNTNDPSDEAVIIYFNFARPSLNNLTKTYPIT